MTIKIVLIHEVSCKLLFIQRAMEGSMNVKAENSRDVFGIILTVLLLASIICPVRLLAADVPCIEANPLSYNFGRIKEGPIYKTTFRVDNCGNATLHIVHIRTSCGCTGAVIGQPVLKPGESSQVKVTFHSAGMPGEFRKYISIQSDDPTCPNLLLEIRGIVVPQKGPSLMLLPYKIYIPSGRPGSTATVRITMANKGTSLLIVKKIVCKRHHIVLFDGRYEIAPQKKRTLTARFKRTASNAGKLVFKVFSNDPNRPVHYLVIMQGEAPPTVSRAGELFGCPECSEQDKGLGF